MIESSDLTAAERRYLYVPLSLSEIYDQLGSMMLGAPTFSDASDFLNAGRTVRSTFYELTEGFGVVRKKLGEERYARLMYLADRAMVLFADDQDDTNGKTDQGRDLLQEIEDIIQEVRSRRVARKAVDEEGRISGD